MFIHAPICGVTIHATPEVMHVHSREMLTTLSSFFRGGFRHTRHILNAYVTKDYCSADAAAHLRRIAAQCDMTAPFVGLLTAVRLRKARLAHLAEDGLRVAALVTAGVGNAIRAGVTPPYRTHRRRGRSTSSCCSARNERARRC